MWNINLLDLGLSDSQWKDIWSFLPIALVIGTIIGIIIGVIAKNANNSRDDRYPLERFDGKIVEKSKDQRGVEWIIIQDSAGKRMKLRNIKTDSLLIYNGDKGSFEYRGQTLYGFKSAEKLEKVDKIPDASEWKCPNCGTINKNYVGTCSCGSRKQ